MINYWDILKLAATASEDDILMAWYNLPLDLQTNDLKLFVKANLDPYYRKTLIHYPNLEQLIPAGFFDDGKPVEKISHNINFFTTPIHKILNQFLKIIKEQEKKSTSDLNKPFLVLLNTGSYSPIHLGHLEMMEKAKTLMNEHYHVLGGYLSPSHDAYVSTKYEKTACYHSDARIALCQEVLHDSDWLMLDPWEARYNNQPINFTDVILHLKKYLNKYVEPIINAHVEIGYVFGSDNAGFTWAFIEQGISICFERPSYELPYETVSNDSLLDHKRHFFIPKTTNIQSSKLIREGEHNFLPSKIKELYFNYKDNSYKIDSDIYIIRNDTVYCTQNIHDDNKTIALNTFVQQLHMDLKYAFSPYIHINTLEINAEEQNSYLNSEAFKDKNIINIDNCTYKPEQYSLGLSRVFNIADGQIYSNTLVSRPGLKPLEEQINLIPAGQYSLVDDDIASGRTIALLRKKLPSTIRINEIIALSEISFSKEFKNTLNNEYNFHDIVDVRDFLIGSKDGGLVVQLPNNKLGRIPYLWPYVSLTSRAKIPPIMQKDFNLQVWKNNAVFYSNLKNKLTIADLDEYFINFCEYVGFDTKITVEDFCIQHVNLFENKENMIC